MGERRDREKERKRGKRKIERKEKRDIYKFYISHWHVDKQGVFLAYFILALTRNSPTTGFCV